MNDALCEHQVRLQRMVFSRVGVHIRIEAAHLAQDQFAKFDAGLARSFAKSIAKRTAQAVSSRMGEDQEATQDRTRVRTGQERRRPRLSFDRGPLPTEDQCFVQPDITVSGRRNPGTVHWAQDRRAGRTMG
jgi:hypothetical protein